MTTVGDYMKEALCEAELALKEGEVAVGAVVVKDGEIIARAHNTVEADSDPTAHAELSAIRAAAKALGDWRLDSCTLYVTLQPCAMCAGAIKNARVRRVVFGAFDSEGGARTECAARGGILEKECAQVLQRTFEKKRIP